MSINVKIYLLLIITFIVAKLKGKTIELIENHELNNFYYNMLMSLFCDCELFNYCHLERVRFLDLFEIILYTSYSDISFE